MTLVRITKDLSLQDVYCEKVAPIDVYSKLVKAWIFEPAEQLASHYPTETDHGMALLALLLLYFEPHGQFLSGQIKGRSSDTFCIAFDAFRAYLAEHSKVQEETTNLPSRSFYKWGRCGLFHSGRMSNELLVDAVGISGYCLAKNPVLDGWLVNPWQLLEQLKNYNEAYVSQLKEADKNDPRRLNFLKTYDVLVKGAADHFNTLRSRAPGG